MAEEPALKVGSCRFDPAFHTNGNHRTRTAGTGHQASRHAQPPGRVSVKHAVTMLWRNVAVVHTADEDRQLGPYAWPKAVELVRKVIRKIRRKFATPRYSKAALLRRDQSTCAYCGGPGDTMDHVLPKSRGGRAEWLNAVIACSDCNQQKADRTPEEAGMQLLFTPRVPEWEDLVAA